MVKSLSAHYRAGLRDWIIQRVSAIVMAGYTFGMVVFFALHREMTFGEWHTLFSSPFVKVATLLTLTFLLLHAWVGMWTILTDYVKPYVIRHFFNALVLLMLIACFFWGLLIIGSV